MNRDGMTEVPVRMDMRAEDLAAGFEAPPEAIAVANTAVMGDDSAARGHVEWLTLGLILGTYLLWGGALLLWPVAPVAAVLALAVLTAFHGSLTHEVLHGHPFVSRAANETLMRLPLGLAVPYCRFRDLHLAHHRDSRLTDPYDDPESNYFDPAVWVGLPRWQKLVLRFNNTLCGRVTVGALIGQVQFMVSEWRLFRDGERGIAGAWGLHGLGVVAVLALVWAAGMPIWAYLLAAYGGSSLLRVRTFLEHRAHERVRGRTVIIEDRGFFAFLFLNNNLHVVHHMHPGVPWYRLPALYRRGKERFCQVNDGYVYRSYGEIFRRFFWKAKDPVPHPLWPEK